MEEMIPKILAQYGLAGLVIAVLGYTVFHMYRAAQRVTKERLADVPILIKALDNNTQATKDQAEAIKSRNTVTEELVKAVDRLSAAQQLASQRNEIQLEAVREKLGDYKQGFEAFADSQRQLAATMRDVRDNMEGGSK